MEGFILFYLTVWTTLVLSMENNSGAINGKWMDIFLRRYHHFLRFWCCFKFLNWIEGLVHSVCLRMPLRNSKSWFALWSLSLLNLSLQIYYPILHGIFFYLWLILSASRYAALLSRTVAIVSVASLGKVMIQWSKCRQS